MSDYDVNATESVLDGVVRRLLMYRGRVSQASKATGIEINSIYRIARGQNKNPCVQTIQPLIDWMDWDDAQRALPRAFRPTWGQHQAVYSFRAPGGVLGRQTATLGIEWRTARLQKQSGGAT